MKNGHFLAGFLLSLLAACAVVPQFQQDVQTSEKPPRLPFSAAVKAGDTYYFSGWGSRNPETGEHPEGFEAQAEQLMKNLASLLDRHGIDFSNVLHSNVYITDIAGLDTFYQIYRRYFPETAPALTVIAIPNLPDTQVELTFIASNGSEIEAVEPEPVKPASPFASAGILTDNYLYISACGGKLFERDFTPENDFSEQVRQCMEGLDGVLRSAGLGFRDVAKSEIFLTDMEHGPEMLDVYKSFFTDDLPAQTIARVTSLPSGAAVSISFIAARREEITRPDELTSGSATSRAVQVGERLYLSGIAGTAGLEIEVEVKKVMDQLGEVLRAADMDFSHVVEAKVYLDDMANYTSMNRVYGSYFENNFPARSCIEMEGLSRGAGVEITLVADSRRR